MYPEISEKVGAAMGIEPSDIRGRSQKHHIAKARRVCMRVFNVMGKGPSEIGELMKLDHTSVIHGLKKCKTESDVETLAKIVASGEKPAKPLSFEFVNEESSERKRPEAAWMFAEERLKHYNPRLHETVTLNVKSDGVVYSCTFQSYVHNARWHWKRVSQETIF